MTKAQIAGLIVFALMLSTGQALFKSAALASARMGTPAGRLLSLANVPAFWAALVLYGVATLLWIYLLQSIPLSRAYPFAALGFVIVPGLAVLMFGERLTAGYVIGAGLIVAGILVITRG